MLLFAPLSSCPDMEPTLSGILQKLETTLDLSAELLQQLQQLQQNSESTNNTRISIAQLQTLVQKCVQEQQPILQSLEHSHSEAMLGNVAATLEAILIALDIADTWQKESIEQATFLCEFQLIPQLRITRENFYFWGYIDKSVSLRKQYYAREFAAHYQNYYVANHAELTYQVSVVVVAYNKLEMTQKCVNSILENTDFAKLNAELILVDNGSSDGTLEFFKSVPQAKVIHFKHNMQIASFTMLPMICRSKYYVNVANDTVMTKDWLEILLQCMASDEKICLASPATCNISNWQSANVPTSNCTELVELAKQHNKANPLLWRERAQIYPPVGIFNLSALNQVGFWDPAFYSFYCGDDEFSVRARRAGFKQILCEDVFCFHKSSGTLNNKLEQGIPLGRELFKRKLGFAPYFNDTTFDRHIVKFLTEHSPDQPLINILSINSGIGDTLLQLKNKLKEAGKQVVLYHLLTQDKFVDDIKHTAAGMEMVPAKALPQAVATCFPNVEFDLICCANACKHTQITPELLGNLAGRLVESGAMALSIENPLFINNVLQALDIGIPLNKLSIINHDALQAQLQPYFKQIKVEPYSLIVLTEEEIADSLQQYKVTTNETTYPLLQQQSFHCFVQK